MSETSLNAETRLTLCRGRGPRLFRNNTGALPDPRGRWVHFGLCSGSADLVGWKPYTITPEDVGKQVAVFVSLESKAVRYKTNSLQVDWQNAIREAGGIAAGIKTVDGARDLLDSWRPGFDWQRKGTWINLALQTPRRTKNPTRI